MNQAELISAVAAEGAVSKEVAERVLKALGSVAQAQIKAGNEITVPGIAKIGVKTRAARAGRNPSTGETINIPAKNVPDITVLKALKDAAAG